MDSVDRELEDLLNPNAQVGEITGWRSWYVYETGSLIRLASLKSGHRQETIWTPGAWMEAECWRVNTLVEAGYGRMAANRVAHGLETRLPVESCKCGWYAAISREHLVSLRYNRYTNNDLRVIGEVAMVGKVIKASQGWRAEKVQARKLYLPFEAWKLAAKLEATYGLEVELSNTWKVA